VPGGLQGRTPLQLAAEELRDHLHFSKAGDVFAWGSGANYQLGTASTEDCGLPVRIDSLHEESIVALAAAKFHSCVVTKEGRVLSWGWGRGGRLGHEAFDGESSGNLQAQLKPRVIAGLARHRITSIAAAKHHTLACSEDGTVYALRCNCSHMKHLPMLFCVHVSLCAVVQTASGKVGKSRTASPQQKSSGVHPSCRPQP
jgi:inhibitor of Bruton tyrosine kinase